MVADVGYRVHGARRPVQRAQQWKGPGADGPRRLTATRWLIALLVLALLPLPWLQGGIRHGTSRPLVLSLDGRMLDTPDLRYLTVVGYYPLAQAITDLLVHEPGDVPNDLFDLDPPDWLRPVVNEPVAAALGMRAAGVTTPVRLRFEGDLPDGRRVTVDRLNGRPIRTAEDLVAARELLAPSAWWFTTRDGARFDGAPSDVLQRVQLRWASRHDVHTTGGVPFGHIAALREPVRDLPVGASHTLIVAIAAYEHASGVDLTRGRTVAGTGELDPMTGTVGRIGGLALKAEAAHRDGVDVLLYPAAQAEELEHVSTRGMHRIPVRTLAEAVEALRTS
jgi:hypothetical protein